MKPFDTTPTSTPGTRYDAPEAFTWKKMKAISLWAGALIVVTAGVWGWSETGVSGIALVSIVIGVACFVAGMFLWTFTGRLVERELPRSQQAQRQGDTYRIHLKREIPVSDRGTVEMEPDTIDLPVAPREFTRIVREMMRNGTSRDKRPAGVSQPLHAKIMRALEDLDGATNGGPGVGWRLADDLDALLRDIERW